MPRIDPLQLLNCLQVLLSPSGGILSKDEVQRLASLMTKFSKKLVSKCVYVLILKNTERTLLGAFMAAGGWTLIQLWLHDAMYSMNWALVKELLELLLITPVDVERLKSNNIPKLVKSLSKREDLQGVHELSNQLVQQWLKIVKDETQSELASQQKQLQPVGVAVTAAVQMVEVPTAKEEVVGEETNAETEQTNSSINTQTFYKLTLKDGKHLLSKVCASEANSDVLQNVEVVEMKEDDIPEAAVTEDPKEKEKDKKDEKKKSHDKSKHKSSSSSKSSSSKDKERNSSHKDRHSSSNSSKDKSRDKDRRDKDRSKDRHRSNGSVKSSSKSSTSSKDKDKKETKEKQAEKDKDTLAKLQPQSLLKLPKIPKKSADDKDNRSKDSKENKKEESKKGTMSVEVRKNNEERPKTVKVYKSKMRSTGLEEEAKPAPPRPTKKPGIPPPIPPPVPLKRPSPIRDLSIAPPEKKTKIDAPLERPGAIKLIPPKPKPPVLQESDMFMDALTASATTKKEPKKRKRRASVSKDSAGTSPPSSPTISGPTGATSPIGLKSIAPPKFYQDTLETEESKSEDAEAGDGKENADTNRTDDDQKEETARAATPTDNVENMEDESSVTNSGALKGVLVYVRRKGPKKSIKWKPDEELVDVQYFELDETERVNVTKAFGDLAKMDVRGEREALQMSRKLPNEDVMDVHTMWRIPMDIDLPDPLAEPGCKSLEKDIQFAREKSVLQALYFNKKMVPDSPAEPDPENYQIKDPVMIPIDDADNPDHDFRNTPWPEPKGSPPPQNIPNNVGPIFTNVQGPFQSFGVAPPPTFQNMQNMQTFTGPPFIPQNVMAGGDWNSVNMNNMHNPQMMPPNMGPPEVMNQGPMNPNMYMPPPDNFNPMMNDNTHRFPPPFNQQGPGMFPQNNFNQNRGGHGFRRGGGNGPWLRMNGPAPGGWNNMRGGGGGGVPFRGGRLCNHYRNKGYCKNRDTCPFFHPNN